MGDFMDNQLVSAKEVDRYAFKNEYVIIDIRSPREFRERHIKGAVCIPYERLVQQARLLKNRTLILYCDRGGLSMKAAKELIDLGYDAKSVVGGIEAYFH
ncbi:MAG: rhodanese-like domain-containing protein [Lachnospiraceae bacterium]|nr:rhodanese-like domain-containing protein [Lachnospiraceae bacterium]MEE1015323.1 rhodanese-like domain-containing protein [Lachnospiraceae bacterium]